MLLALAALTLAATLGDAAAAASGAANAQAPRLGGIGLPAGMAPPDLSASSAPPAPTSQLERQIAEADLDLHDLSKSFGSSTLTDVEIASRLAAVAPIQSNLAAVIAALTPKLARIDARLAQLGPAPGPGQIPEASQIADNRRALSHARQNLDADIKQARLLAVEAGQLASMLQSRRAEQLTAQLWTHSRSILDPGLWRECAEALPADGQRLQTVLSDQLDAASKASGSSLVVAGWALALLASLIIAVPVRLALNRLAAARIGRLPPQSRLRRTLLAMGRVVVAAGTPLAALVLARGTLAGTGAITPVFEQLGPLFIRSAVFAAYFSGLFGALLAPMASVRLAPIPDDLVKRLRPYPLIIGATAAVANFIRGLNTILGASQPTTVAGDGLAVLIELLAVGAALSMLGRARAAHLERGAEESDLEPGESRAPWILAALVAWLTLAAALAAALLGFVQMASTLMRELVWVATVVATLFLLLRFLDEIFPALFAPDRSLGRFLRVNIGLSPRGLEQVAVLLSGFSRLAVLLAAWLAVLAPFGAGAGEVFGRLTSSQLVIKVGQVVISPGAVFGAVLVLLVGLFITRVIRNWLEKSYLPKTQMDVGLRTSLSSGVTYLGALVAIVLTFGYLGLSFDRIALFASALSVGVGFGLQAVIGNFVSGLILLAERPVRVGDWIAIGELEGDVKKINVRATEIEMQDRSKLIVPNSDLISKTVRNVTHSGSLGRIKIVLKIADDADPNTVREIVKARLEQHPDLRSEPAPAIYLTNVADGALEFTAFAYVDSPRLAYRVRSELLFQIVPDLRARGVALANSTPVVNVGLPDRAIEPGPEAAR